MNVNSFILRQQIHRFHQEDLGMCLTTSHENIQKYTFVLNNIGQYEHLYDKTSLDIGHYVQCVRTFSLLLQL